MILNNAETINSKFIEPLSATQTRRLDWDSQFKKASYDSQQSSTKSHDWMSDDYYVKNNSSINQLFAKNSHRQMLRDDTKNSVVYNNNVISKYVPNLDAKPLAKQYANANNIAVLYQTQQMKHIRYIESNKYSPMVRPRIMLRLVKMAEGSYRLGVITYGATQALILELKKLVAFMSSRKGKITSGYVNGVNCTGNEDS